MTQQTTELDPLKTICAMRWDYPVFTINRSEFRNCCKVAPKRIYDADLQEHGTDAFANSEQEIRSRFDLIRGIEARECRHCWALEKNGVQSLRTISTKPEQFYNKIIAPTLVNAPAYSEEILRSELAKIDSIDHPTLRADAPRTIEIVLGSLCDMKCMYCSRLYSTQWAAEDLKWGIITQAQYDNQEVVASDIYNEKLWEWFEKVKDGVYRVSILGGEPLINPEFYKFVDRFIELFGSDDSRKYNKPELFITTNMNTSPSYFEKFFRNFPKLSEIFKIYFAVSMESVGDRAEYIRNGLDWQRFDRNINAILSKTDLDFKISFVMTINVLSVTNTKQFMEYIADLYRKYGRPIGIGTNIVDWPFYLRPNMLTANFSSTIDDCVVYMKQQQDLIDGTSDLRGDSWSEYIAFLESLSYNIKNDATDRTATRREFANWIDTFDLRRNLNLLETFPELTDFYNYCKSL
jgi:sulfatase maturation enzyme AslB (radical SAM superfamily)